MIDVCGRGVKRQRGRSEKTRGCSVADVIGDKNTSRCARSAASGTEFCGR
jgi:hypothetical protein